MNENYNQSPTKSTKDAASHQALQSSRYAFLRTSGDENRRMAAREYRNRFSDTVSELQHLVMQAWHAETFRDIFKMDLGSWPKSPSRQRSILKMGEFVSRRLAGSLRHQAQDSKTNDELGRVWTTIRDLDPKDLVVNTINGSNGYLDARNLPRSMGFFSGETVNYFRLPLQKNIPLSKEQPDHLLLSGQRVDIRDLYGVVKGRGRGGLRVAFDFNQQTGETIVYVPVVFSNQADGNGYTGATIFEMSLEQYDKLIDSLSLEKLIDADLLRLKNWLTIALPKKFKETLSYRLLGNSASQQRVDGPDWQGNNQQSASDLASPGAHQNGQRKYPSSIGAQPTEPPVSSEQVKPKTTLELDRQKTVKLGCNFLNIDPLGSVGSIEGSYSVPKEFYVEYAGLLARGREKSPKLYIHRLRPVDINFILYTENLQLGPHILSKDGLVRGLSRSEQLPVFKASQAIVINGQTNEQVMTYHIPVETTNKDIFLLRLTLEEYGQLKDKLLERPSASVGQNERIVVGAEDKQNLLLSSVDIDAGHGMAKVDLAQGHSVIQDAQGNHFAYDYGIATTEGSRESNQDAPVMSSITFPDGRTGIYATVMDGMGGHQDGEIASKLAAEAGVNYLKSLANNQQEWQAINTKANTLFTKLKNTNRSSFGRWAPRRALDFNDALGMVIAKRTIEQENRAVYEYGKKYNIDLGTTRSGGIIIGDRIYVMNEGDSRTLITDGAGNTVAHTEDHSLVARLVKAGQITAEQALDHPQGNVILRVLGDKQSIEIKTPDQDPRSPDVFVADIPHGGLVIMNCDGINGGLREVHPGQSIIPIAKNCLLSSASNQEQAAALALVAAAAPFSGDNDTAIVIRRK